MKMEIVQKKTKKRKHKPKAKKMGTKKTTSESGSGEKAATKAVVADQKNVPKTVNNSPSKAAGSGSKKLSRKTKKMKRELKRHATKYVEFVKGPGGSDNKTDGEKNANVGNKTQTANATKQGVDVKGGKSKGKKKKKDADSHMKVQTHASLYRNPQQFSSNWKNLLQEIAPGKKEAPKRKAEPDASSPAAKRRKQNEKIQSKSSKIQEDPAEKKPEVWFDDVDEDLLDLEVPTTTTESETRKGKTKKTDAQGESTADESAEKDEASSKLVKERSFEGLTKAVAMDCEMVGVGSGGEDSVLARVSVVNQFGKCIYDKYVKPREQVTDYRTQFSGIRPADLKNAEEFSSVQKDVYEIMKGRILVGHALHNDLKVLYLDHPHKKIRDTSRYRGFRKLFEGRTPSLKKLTGKVLNVNVQKGEHNSVEDAQAAMRLYTMHKVQWEKEIKLKHNKKLLKPVVATDDDAQK